MRILFTMSFAANLALAVATWFVLPDRVAIHFGTSGAPDNWSSSGLHVILMAVVHLLLYAAFISTPWVLRHTPARWVNLPNRAYWMRSENRGDMERILMPQLYAFGALTFGFMFAIGLLAFQANRSTPVHFRTDLFWWPFGIYVLYTVYWCANLYRVFRIPRNLRGTD